jgi:bifunctional ADP-heptose synthase (sugar kinase/adenylyltransferase)
LIYGKLILRNIKIIEFANLYKNIEYMNVRNICKNMKHTRVVVVTNTVLTVGIFSVLHYGLQCILYGLATFSV